MFIEDLRQDLMDTKKSKNFLSSKSKDLIKCASRTLQVLKLCTHFSWEDYDTPPVSLLPKDSNHEQYIKGLHLPFPHMTINYKVPFSYTTQKDRAINCVAVIEEPVEGLITISIWSKETDTEYKTTKQGWSPSMVSALVSLRKNFCYFQEAIDHYKNIGYQELSDYLSVTDNYITTIDNYGFDISSVDGMTDDDYDNDTKFLIHDLNYAIFPYIYLLNTRNIPMKETRTIRSYKFSSNYKMKNPPVIYKTINLKFPLERSTNNPSHNTSGESTHHKKFHVCMGHVKHYTEERPLFGHYSGPVWCPPHTRGNIEQGSIVNNYKASARKKKKKKKRK